MARKRDFNAEEWSLVVEAPALAAMRVIAADRGGTFRETLSLARAYQEARKRGGGELLDEIVTSAPQLDPSQLRTPEQLRDEGDRRLREALGLVESKGTPEEVEHYRQFILGLADTVAHAHKEGGFLGIGGKEVSDSERVALDEIAATLGSASG